MPEVVKGYKDNRHTILLVGPPKSGKSTLACNLFGKSDTVVIAYDRRGLKSVGEIDAILIDPKRVWDDTLEALSILTKQFKDKKAIVVNDMTHASRQMLMIQPASKDGRKRYATAIDWLRQFVEKITTEFIDQNIILEAVDMFVRSDTDDVLYTAPNVIGRDTFATELPGMVDHVFYVNLPKSTTSIVNGKPVTTTIRTILTQSTGHVLAGNRMNQAGKPKILDISEEVMIEDDSFANIDKLRSKLLGG